MTSPTTTEMELVPGYEYNPDDPTKDGRPALVQKRYTDGAQHVDTGDLADSALATFSLQQIRIAETLESMLTELKTITYYLQTGLGVADEPETIRSDIDNQL